MLDPRHPPPPHHPYQRSTSGSELYTMSSQPQPASRSLHDTPPSSTISPGSSGWYPRGYSGTATSSSQASPQPQPAPPPSSYNDRRYQPQPQLHARSPPPGATHSRGPSYSTDRAGVSLLAQPSQLGQMRHSSPLAHGGYAPPPGGVPAHHHASQLQSRQQAMQGYGHVQGQGQGQGQAQGQGQGQGQGQQGRSYTPGGYHHAGGPYDPPPPPSSGGGGVGRYERR